MREGNLTALEKISFFQHRRDEVPNQLLAKELAESEDYAGIREIADNLTNKDRNISSDCLKVMYEIGYLRPDLIAPFVNNFLALLKNKDNRKVWGAMIALGTIADLAHEQIAPAIDEVLTAIQKGSLITIVWGVRVLAKTTAHKPNLESRVLLEMINILQICLPRDIPTHLESMLPMITPSNRDTILAVVDSRRASMTVSHLTRLKKVLRAMPS